MSFHVHANGQLNLLPNTDANNTETNSGPRGGAAERIPFEAAFKVQGTTTCARAPNRANSSFTTTTAADVFASSKANS